MSSLESATGDVLAAVDGFDRATLGRERWRRVALSALGGAGFRAVSTAGSFVTIPLVLHYLGRDRFGVFIAVTQLSALLAFSDLGLGNGLVTPLTGSLARGEIERARRLVSSALLMLTGVAFMLAVVLVVAWPIIPWTLLFSGDAADVAEAKRSVVVFGALFLTGIPAAIGQKVHLALQEGLRSNLWSLAGAGLSIAGTVACVLTRASVPWLVGVTVGMTTLSALANSSWLFRFHRRDLSPRLASCSLTETRSMLGAGGLFFILASSAAIAYEVDALVVMAILGQDQVTTYSLPSRLFALPLLLVSLVLLPLWPAFSDSLARGDRYWAQRNLRRAIGLTCAVTVPSALCLLLTTPTILRLWLGGGQQTPTLLLVSFAAWTALAGVSGPIAMFLNGAHVVRFQVYCSLSMAAVNIVLSIVLTKAIGVSGPVLGSLIAQVSCILLPSLLYLRRFWRAAAL